MRIVTFLLSSLIVISLLLSGCGDDSNSTTSSSSSDFVASGENGFLKDDSVIAIDDKAEDELINYANANNTEAEQRMIDSGQIFQVPKGTPITVVNRGFTTATIELKDGQRGVVPVEFVTKQKPN